MMTEVEQVYTHPHKRFASEGVGTAGLVTGIAGTVLGLANSGMGGGLLGSVTGGGNRESCVSRYEMGLEQKIAALESDKKMLEANTYTDRKLLDVYGYVDGRLRGIEAQICQQSVVNAQVAANISCMQSAINTLNGLTKTVVPIDNVCPAPMPQYNSWTAPTAAAGA